MDAIEVLHNAARRFCGEQYEEWVRRYAELSAGRGEGMTLRAGTMDYSDEAWGLFPRYNVWDAIRSDVERFVPADFRSLDELRAMLEAAGETARNSFTDFKHPIAVRAGAEERARFVDFARTADVAGLAGLPRLPFRRVLGQAEHGELHAAFVRRWGRWYGGEVDGPGVRPEAVTIHVEAMEAPGAYDHLRGVLRGRGVGRLLELREWGDGYELDTETAGFTYTGAEGFWTAREMEWMVYASHESSITFGGAWLAGTMRAALREFDRYLYRGWDLAAYA